MTGEPGPAGRPARRRPSASPALPRSTTYYFAIKARDEGGNIGDLSNIVMATTLAPDVTPPAWVVDLVARQQQDRRRAST